MAELVHAQAAEGIDADPLELELDVRTKQRLMRGMTFSGCFSAIGSASQPSWKSMRQTLSGWRCSSTDWLGWNGGSNQNQRSDGKSAFIFTSAIRKRSRKVWPLLSSPIKLRTGLRRRRRQPGNRIAAVLAVRGVHRQLDAVRMLDHAGDLVLPAHVNQRQFCGPLVQIAFDR
jgi:hypothetical protein